MKRKLLMISISVMTVLFMFAGFSLAETVNTSADLLKNKKTEAYLHSRPMLQTAYRLGVEQDKKFGLQSNCLLQYKVKPFSMIVVTPIDFPDDKQHPTKGLWVFRYILERCGDSKIYNAMFLADKNGDAPSSRAYFPGSTNAGPVLVKDALTMATVNALVQSGNKDCKNYDIFDMRVTEPPHDVVEGDKTFKRVWKEMWTFRVCGQMMDVPMTFVPDATGGGTSFRTTFAPTKARKDTAKP